MATDEDGEMRFWKQLRVVLLRVGTVAEVNIPSLRMEERISASKKAHIKHSINAQEARATGTNILTSRFVDAAREENSRWCARESLRWRRRSTTLR